MYLGAPPDAFPSQLATEPGEDLLLTINRSAAVPPRIRGEVAQETARLRTQELRHHRESELSVRRNHPRHVRAYAGFVYMARTRAGSTAGSSGLLSRPGVWLPP
jgi:hypothetical protein